MILLLVLPLLPLAAYTPGATQPVAHARLCTSGYSKTVRHVTQAQVREVFATYKIPLTRRSCCEVDHLVSLELGGTNATTNLWPETYVGPCGARRKDVLENRLHWLVCHDQLDVKTAQHALATDWIAAYRTYVGSLRCPPTKRSLL